MTLKRWNFLTQPILKSSKKGWFWKKNCPNRTFRSDFAKLGSEILYLFPPKNGRVCFCCNFTLSDFDILFFKLKLSTSWERCCQGKNYSVLSQPDRGPGSENYAQILQLYKELTSRWKVRFRQKKIQIEVRNVLYKVLMLTDPHDPSERIPSPSKLGNMKNLKKIKNFKTCSQCLHN